MGVAAGIYLIKDAVVTINSVQYDNQVTKAQLTPDVPIQTQRTLDPDGAIVDVDSAVWTFEVTALQKNNTGGLAKALRALEPGEEVDCVLQPQNTVGEEKATFTIKALPMPFGGEQGNWPTAEMAFPVVGQPVFTTTT